MTSDAANKTVLNIVLARHGNTFAPGDKVVWAGATNDLPLVESGEQQAHGCAGAIRDAGLVLHGIYTGPLQRTRVFANIIQQQLAQAAVDSAVFVDERLREVDYGGWTGLSNDEVLARFGEHDGRAALEAWEEHSIWNSKHWIGSPEAITQNVQSLVQELITQYTVVGETRTVLLVSSNGILRYFLTLIDGEFERRITDRSFKVKTGHLCWLQYKQNKFTCLAWNTRTLL